LPSTKTDEENSPIRDVLSSPLKLKILGKRSKSDLENGSTPKRLKKCDSISDFLDITEGS